jgi:hypothetical protein
MRTTQHIEKHFTATETVRDIVIGMSDGLTVPFALAAGLSGAVASAGIIITAGLAEIAAGAIAMGLVQIPPFYITLGRQSSLRFGWFELTGIRRHLPRRA